MEGVYLLLAGAAEQAAAGRDESALRAAVEQCVGPDMRPHVLEIVLQRSGHLKAPGDGRETQTEQTERQGSQVPEGSLEGLNDKVDTSEDQIGTEAAEDKKHPAEDGTGGIQEDSGSSHPERGFASDDDSLIDESIVAFADGREEEYLHLHRGLDLPERPDMKWLHLKCLYCDKEGVLLFHCTLEEDGSASVVVKYAKSRLPDFLTEEERDKLLQALKTRAKAEKLLAGREFFAHVTMAEDGSMFLGQLLLLRLPHEYCSLPSFQSALSRYPGSSVVTVPYLCLPTDKENATALFSDLSMDTLKALAVEHGIRPGDRDRKALTSELVRHNKPRTVVERLIVGLINGKGGIIIFGVERDGRYARPAGFSSTDWEDFSDWIHEFFRVSVCPPLPNEEGGLWTLSPPDSTMRSRHLFIKPADSLFFLSRSSVNAKVRVGSLSHPIPFDQLRTKMMLSAEKGFPPYLADTEIKRLPVTVSKDVYFSGTTYPGHEGISMEWKEYRLQVDLDHVKEVARDQLSSFANTTGGTLVVGAEDKTGVISGTSETLVDTLVGLLQAAGESLWPPLPVSVERVPVKVATNSLLQFRQEDELVTPVLRVGPGTTPEKALISFSKKANLAGLLRSVVPLLTQDRAGIVLLTKGSWPDGSSSLSGTDQEDWCKRLLALGDLCQSHSPENALSLLEPQFLVQARVDYRQFVTFLETPRVFVFSSEDSHSHPTCLELGACLPLTRSLERIDVLERFRCLSAGVRSVATIVRALDTLQLSTQFMLVVGPMPESLAINERLAQCLADYPWSIVLDLAPDHAVCRPVVDNHRVPFQRMLALHWMKRQELDLEHGTMLWLHLQDEGDSPLKEYLPTFLTLLRTKLSDSRVRVVPFFLLLDSSPTASTIERIRTITKELVTPVYSVEDKRNVTVSGKPMYWSPQSSGLGEFQLQLRAFACPEQELATALRKAQHQQGTSSQPSIIATVDGIRSPHTPASHVLQRLRGLRLGLLNSSTSGKEPAAAREAYYRGSPPTWQTVAGSNDVPDRILFDTVMHKKRHGAHFGAASKQVTMTTVRKRLLLGLEQLLAAHLSEVKTVTIHHQPEAGGSTCILRLAWDLREHFPAAAVDTSIDAKVISESLVLLHAETKLPVIVLIDGEQDVVPRYSDALQNLLGGKGKFLFLRALKEPAVDSIVVSRSRTPTSFLLKKELTADEKKKFISVLRRELGNPLPDGHQEDDAEDEHLLRKTFSCAGTVKLYGLYRLALGDVGAFQRHVEAMVRQYLRSRPSAEEVRILCLLSLVRLFCHSHGLQHAELLALPQDSSLPFGMLFSASAQELVIFADNRWQVAVSQIGRSLLDLANYPQDKLQVLCSEPYSSGLVKNKDVEATVAEHLPCLRAALAMPRPVWQLTAPFMVLDIVQTGERCRYVLQQLLKPTRSAYEVWESKVSLLVQAMASAGEAGEAAIILLFMHLALDNLPWDSLSPCYLYHRLALVVRELGLQSKSASVPKMCALALVHAENNTIRSHISTTLASYFYQAAYAHAPDGLDDAPPEVESVLEHLRNLQHALQHCDQAGSVSRYVNHLQLLQKAETHTRFLEFWFLSWTRGWFRKKKHKPDVYVTNVLAGQPWVYQADESFRHINKLSLNQDHFLLLTRTLDDLETLVDCEDWAASEARKFHERLGKLIRGKFHYLGTSALALASHKDTLGGSTCRRNYLKAHILLDASNKQGAATIKKAFKETKLSDLKEVIRCLKSNLNSSEDALFPASMQLFTRALPWAGLKELLCDDDSRAITNGLLAWHQTDALHPIPLLLVGVVKFLFCEYNDAQAAFEKAQHRTKRTALVLTFRQAQQRIHQLAPHGQVDKSQQLRYFRGMVTSIIDHYVGWIRISTTHRSPKTFMARFTPHRWHMTDSSNLMRSVKFTLNVIMDSQCSFIAENVQCI